MKYWIRTLLLALVVCGLTMPAAAQVYDHFAASGTGTSTRTIAGFTPVGTPRGIVAIVEQNNATDEISGITYGGVSMTEVAGSPNLKASGEAAGVYVYFLGASIPTGAQDVVATATGTTATKILFVYSLTAAADTELVDIDATISTDSAADPSVTLSLGGRTSFAAIAFVSGHDAGSQTTPLTSWTVRNEFAAGGLVIGTYSFDTIGTADVTAGWTQTAEDALAIAFAVSEVSAGNPPCRRGLLLAGAGC